MNNETVNKKGKLSTVIIITLAVILVSGAIGFGGSQLHIGIINILEGSYPRGGTTYEISTFDRNRDSLPFIPENTSFTADFTPAVDTLTAPANTTPYTGRELYKAVSDTVVGIKIYQSGWFAGETDVIGSGVIFTTDGFVITCEHVIAGAEKVYVVVNDYDDPSIKHEYEAVVYGADQPTDLAVLKIERKEPFKAAAIGFSSELEVGQYVFAIGNPVGLEKTMTMGIVSGLQRDLGDETYELPSIQTDAALNMGNSGCPLFDEFGNVVGIVNKKIVYYSQIDNLGFAISIDEAKPIINELMLNGAVTNRPMLGITAREINPYNYMSFGVDVTEGLYVDSVRQGSPAAESGLSRGDIIIKIDGKDVASVYEVQSVIKSKSAGDIVEVTIIRYDNYGGSEEMKLKFALISSGG
ncbi:MAG: trypsin-like peptidase domain-containing protein [Oscillospiraceae bacterium]|nr:trypsin-like peptidase domain-containing protein [Oscillospiraceae bacterium]